MSRLVSKAIKAAASPAVTPCVLAGFLLLYVGIAFGSNEPLTALMAITRGNVALIALLALVPLNGAARLLRESGNFLKRHRALSGAEGIDPHGLFDDAVELPPESRFEGEGGRLQSLGYRVRSGAASLSASRGVTLFPARFLYLLGMVLLFCGILLSLTGRVTHRQVVLEGEALPVSRDLVQRIVLKEEPGLFLQRTLDIAVAGEGGGERHFGLYPPGTHRGHYLYPRYLGVAPLLRFSAPDLPGGFEQFAVLSIYPPGKEDTFQIPGSPYRFIFQMAPGEGPDPYATGKITLQFRLLKGEAQVFAGSAPLGGEAGEGGYRLALPEFRRAVVTDFVQDAGVPLIWSAGVLLLLSLLWFVPVRLLRPRQEILLVRRPGGVSACSRAEGGRRAHAGRFHDLLDQLQQGEGGMS
ncbi:hypothetical protein KP004_16740 [Geomonas oryzisoli]|uniref:ResB-like domain-containing protein n=1 Tax=Geomonas oryzisoli TaxID=2847992 RepID=A0ABX8J660_9BACT|nr:hypothetical protein [Geomonas oryzisoli]QWV92807.1 hypothetical protein KP004_16740 [Geomonas oryzisoli]